MSAEITGCSFIDIELDRQFGAAPAGLSEQASQHLAVCVRCRRLYESLSSDSTPQHPSPETRARIEAAIRNSLQSVTPLPSLYVRAGLFFGISLLVGLIKMAMLGVAGLHLMSVPQLLGNILVAVIGGSLLSISLAAQMTPGSLRRFSSGTAAGLLAASFLVGAAILTPWNAEDVFLAEGWPCFRAGALMALPVAFVYWLLVRRGRPLSAVSLGGVLGALAGLLGATVLQFTCSRQEISHLLVWHGGVILVAATLGVLVAQAARHIDAGPA